jgi:hypothetical protein
MRIVQRKHTLQHPCEGLGHHHQLVARGSHRQRAHVLHVPANGQAEACTGRTSKPAPAPSCCAHVCTRHSATAAYTFRECMVYPAGMRLFTFKWTTHVTCAVLCCAVLCSSPIGARSCLLVQRHCSISVPEQLLEEELLACFE